ncbi:PAS domain-containing protein [Pseudomonas seleniipraecipitans]|uniref:histidine kinase n=1 Tax=Phytopseudomonas seleniipraecipitans TaxID=640205 RepID=A0ABY5JCR8_9GAMM|nr:PAS domain-containing protein [Pseudomonas seleniipraecipitans]UUD64647.1 PAS domain-containing protein [Pseudomonas seleniipraecipitans]
MVGREGRKLLIGGGEVGELIRRHDWAQTPIGSPDGWPQALHNALELMLNSPESMYLAWGEELTFFYNDAYRPILGSRLEGALGKSLPVLWADAWGSVRESLHKALAGQAIRSDYAPIIMAREGVAEETWWSYSFSPLRDDDGSIRGVLCFTREMTNQVKTTLALAESEQRLDALVRSSSEVRFSISADWSQLHQLKGGDFIPDTDSANSDWLNDYIPADARDAVRAEIARAISTRSTYSIEHPVNRVDGSVGWAQVRAVPLFAQGGKITGWLGAASDITDRKNAEAVLKASEAQLRDFNALLEEQVAERTAELRLYRDVIQANAVPTCIFDTDYRIIAFNEAHSQAFRDIYGYSLAGNEVLPELLPAEQAVVLREQVRRVLSGETFRVSAEFGDPSALRRSYELAYTPLRDPSGSVAGGFCFAHDVTDQIKSQLELGRAQAALRQAQKIEAVGQLTGGVAHDFNNLLTIIKSSCDLLKRPNFPDDRRLRYVEAISNTVDRAARLTSQLLAFARRQTLKPEVFAPCDNIHSLAEMLATLSGPRIDIDIQSPETPYFVYADSDQFDTALVNMAVNARDALGGSGRIVIRVAPAENIPAVRLHPVKGGRYVAVAVSDTGAGIAPEQLESIFEPFFTTKELGKGTGLGLSQVFGFAKQSGGEIIVESKVGEGSTFTLYLPRVDSRVEHHVEKPPAPAPLAQDHGTRVLVVEDNPDIGAFCQAALVELGYRPSLAADAEEALQRLANNPDAFDVVFSDVVMPGMNGIDLGKAIRRLYPLLPVVLTSGYSEVLAQHGSYGFDLLQKPYSIDQLSSFLTKATLGSARTD